MKKIDMSQVVKDISAGKYGIDQVKQDVEAGKYGWGHVSKLPESVQLKLSKEMARQQYNRAMAKIQDEPRDWSEPIDLEDRYACGLRGEEYYRIEYLTIAGFILYFSSTLHHIPIA